MSETLVAARIPLDGPLPRPNPYGLVSVALEQTSPRPTDRGGALIVPYPDAMPDANDPCTDGSAREKITPDSLELPDGFPTWTAYLGEVCTTRSVGPWDAWKARANLALAGRESWALERQLLNGEFAPASGSQVTPTLQSEATLPAGSGSVAARSAIAFLEGAIAGTGIAGVLHLTPEVVTYLGFETFRDDRGTLRTASGTPVIVGAGYSSQDEDEDIGAPDAGGSEAGTGQSWVYASGPILYAHSPTIFNLPDTIREATDRSDNTVVYRAERDLWVGWDTQLAAAVLADWSP